VLKLNSPYVYVITEVSSGKKYIGCRTARDASPTDTLNHLIVGKLIALGCIQGSRFVYGWLKNRVAI
jgi:hypothetical protein